MRFEFISRTRGNTRLIILFSGWSTAPGFYEACLLPGWDTIVVWDYIETDRIEPLRDTCRDHVFLETFDDVIGRYKTRFILAWSLGVAAAEHLAATGVLNADNIAAAFAVNGTPFPSDDDFGIPEAIYSGTAASLDSRNLMKFRRRMTGRHDLFTELPKETADETRKTAYIDDIQSLKRQLEVLSVINTEGIHLPWLRVYIGENDLIIPPANQKRFWSEKGVYTVSLATGHYIPLDIVAKKIIPDLNRIAHKFSEAKEYDDNADAQKRVARDLSEMLPEMPECRMLEIGTGSGYFSRLAAERLKPRHITYIDLNALPEFGLAPSEKYFQGDAEQLLDGITDNSFDAVVSSSTMQWFADPERFFANVSRILKPKGIFVCSTYLPGNLGELDDLRPSPLLYRPETELRRMLGRHFGEFETVPMEIRLSFPSRRRLLLHLKRTGVAGATTAKNPISSLPESPTLTYRPLLIKASKPTEPK